MEDLESKIMKRIRAKIKANSALEDYGRGKMEIKVGKKKKNNERSELLARKDKLEGLYSRKNRLIDSLEKLTRELKMLRKK